MYQSQFRVCKVVCVKSLFLPLGTSLQIQLQSDLMRLFNYELAWSTSLRYCSSSFCWVRYADS